MKLDLDTVLRKLSDWKEKILFGAVLLLTLNVARGSSPLGGGVDRIEAEARQAALTRAEVEETTGMKALDTLVNPPDVSPTLVKEDEIIGLFFDERNVFPASAEKRKPSGWMLGQDNFERLPPLPLIVPGMPALADFDLPAGPVPELPRARGMVPRDNRGVVLTVPENREFKE